MGKIRVDEITDELGTGSPSFPNGIRAATVTDEAGTGAPSFPFGAVGIEGVPTGAFVFFAMNTPPTGWLKANGAAISRTTYSALFDAIGTTFGAGDGSTTFNLPDMRGEFPRGWDDGRGVDSGRSFGSAQLDQMQRITGESGRGGNASGSTMGLFRTDWDGAGAIRSSSDQTTRGATSTTGGPNKRIRFEFDSAFSPNARVSSTTSGETRSRNIALLACIKF